MSSPKDSFADLFEAQSKAIKPSRPVVFKLGDKVKATVVQVGREAIFVELEGHRQAYLDAADFRDADGAVHIQVGDPLEANIISIDELKGEIRLGRSLGRADNIAAVEQALASGLPLEGKVVAVNKGGLEVELGGQGSTRAFCPISQADNRFVEDPSQFIGRTLQFAVVTVREGGKSIVLSRRAVLQAQAQLQEETARSALSVGKIVRGTVTSVRDFGAFVDIGGIEGMIPRSELSYDRSASANDLIHAGDVVDVQIQEIKDVEPKGAKDQRTRLKITLSLKALSSDPWDSVDSVASEGKVLQGTVSRVTDFGAFVRLTPGIEGLLHVSELSGKVQNARQQLQVGQPLSVVVKSLDRAAKKISLTYAPEGATVGSVSLPLSFPVGSIIQGVVERIEPYGIFVQINGTRGRSGRGLVPNAELGTQRGDAVRKSFPEGSTVTAKVLETGEGRLRLSIRAVREDEERNEFDGYREQAGAAAKLGTLGDLLSKNVSSQQSERSNRRK